METLNLNEVIEAKLEPIFQSLETISSIINLPIDNVEIDKTSDDYLSLCMKIEALESALSDMAVETNIEDFQISKNKLSAQILDIKDILQTYARNTEENISSILSATNTTYVLLRDVLSSCINEVSSLTTTVNALSANIGEFQSSELSGINDSILSINKNLTKLNYAKSGVESISELPSNATNSGIIDKINEILSKFKTQDLYLKVHTDESSGATFIYRIIDGGESYETIYKPIDYYDYYVEDGDGVISLEPGILTVSYYGAKDEIRYNAITKELEIIGIDYDNTEYYTVEFITEEEALSYSE